MIKKSHLSIFILSIMIFGCNENSDTTMHIDKQDPINKVDSKKIIANIQKNLILNKQINDLSIQTFINDFDLSSGKFDDIDYTYYLDIINKHKDNFTSEQKIYQVPRVKSELNISNGS